MAYMKDSTGRRLDSIAVPSVAELAARGVRNILDYGVTRGTTTSQTAAIKAALDAAPGEAFYFPPGDYRLDTSLVISQSNSLILAPTARLYAGATMATLIDYVPDLPGGQYAEDKVISGGIFDGANKAGTVLSFRQILRLSLTQFTIRDGINRGIVTQAGTGAELLASDGRLYNTTAANATDNVAIDNQMGDCHFHNIVIRDWTIGVRDNNGGRWDTVHPWLSGAHMAERYPTSVAFDLTNASNVINCYADTYRYGFRLNTSTGRPRLRNVRCAWNPAIPDATAIANPSYVFDNTSGVGAFVYGIDMGGRAAAPADMILGTTAKVNISNPISSGNVNGVATYSSGVQTGVSTFTPNVFGSTTGGTQTYGSRSGYMEVRDGLVTFTFSVSVTLGATISGNLRIGGLPMVPGAASVSVGHGPISTASGVTTAVGLTGANGSAGPLAAIPLTVAGAEISAGPLAGTTLLLRGSITCPFVYPS